MKVCKFGGSSVADAERIARICDIVASDDTRRIVVVSAPGKRTSGDTKVTDLLIACAEARLDGLDAASETAAVVERFASIVRDLGIEDDVVSRIEEGLRAIVAADTSHAGLYMDSVKAAGEDCCAKLVAAALTQRGTAAVYVSPRDAGLLLSEEYGNARLLPESYANLASLKERSEVVVFPGFFGYTKAGDVVTFSRGGSDITGAILAAAVQAEVYENFTDVDSVFSADPRIVPTAKGIRELTFREMRELAYAGFSVLHDEAIIPAVHAGIPIVIKNTNAPDAAGTTIVPEHRGDVGRVVGIAGQVGFATFFVSKYLMNREVGFGRRLLQVFEDEGLSFEHAPSGIDNMSVIVKEQDLTPEIEGRLVRCIKEDLAADDVSVEHGLALVMVVGEGMRFMVGIAGAAATAMGEAGVNIEMMNQGSSEISIMFGVKAESKDRAVEALYHVFFGDGS